MSTKKQGKQSLIFDNPPVITHWSSIVGKKEAEGPLSAYFDKIQQDTKFGQKTWEQAEGRMQRTALETLTNKAGLQISDIELICSGDLLNQCIGSSMPIKNLNIPHLGLYGACSTMAESLLVAAMSVDGGFFQRTVAMTSSHFASSERQYRFPLGYGGQRPPTAQWTVTGSGAAMVEASGHGPKISACTIGTVVDLGITDANNMGAAMAPSALATIKAHLQDMNRTSSDYDLIITGDLGQLGKDILLSLGNQQGLSLGGKLTDCGTMIYDLQKQDVHCGGSGCGCSAVVLCGYLLDQLKTGSLKRILFCGTGALLSPTSIQQGVSIGGVCHAVCIEGE